MTDLSIEHQRALAVEQVEATSNALHYAREDFRDALSDARQVGVSRKRLAVLTGYSEGHVLRLIKGGGTC